ncbi:hypothetical protein G6O67_004902 [Ophiocordyceps sinensis]|uniref:Uncharacterized protein n=1 Tax=Ophiocordyceps sinensis TaxID=72228 RepID=A0A8H4PQD3_9HYPO|nr:hypothetical protein G6O67_004902 [Ophiocordyceps sinensis]
MSPAPTAEHSRQNHLGFFVHFLSPVLNGLAGLEEFTEAVGAYSEPKDFRDFWMLGGRNLIKEVVGVNALTGAVMATHVSFLDVFVKDTSCRIALSRKSRALALVSGDAEPGDELWQEANEESPTERRASDMGGQGPMGEEINCRQCIVGGEREKLLPWPFSDHGVSGEQEANRLILARTGISMHPGGSISVSVAWS